jgi:hypothetical protein
MSNWLVGLSERPKTAEDLLQESLDNLPVSELKKLAFDLDPLSLPTRVDDMGTKIHQAIRHGQELAHEQPELEKVAFLPALMAGAARLAPVAGRVLGGGGAKAIAGGIAKDMAVSAGANKLMGALKPAASTAGEAAGGFKYASLAASLGTQAGKAVGTVTGSVAGNASRMLRGAAAYTVKNPGTALTAAGAVGGAIMAPRDEQTGQKQYMKGALIGGGLAAGANAVSNGSMANKMRSSVMNRNSPLLGDKVRQYAMDASAAAGGKTRAGVTVNGQTRYAKAPAAAATQAPVAATRTAPVAPAAAPGASYAGGPVMRGPVAVTPQHTSGPSMGAIKVASDRFSSMSSAQQILYVAQLDALEKRANRQTLTYDPATKTFTRQHLDASPGSDSITGAGAKPIPAGHTEPVRNNMTHAGFAPYGSNEYRQARMQQAGLNLNHQGVTGGPAAVEPKVPEGRTARWETNEGMTSRPRPSASPPPVINKKPINLPGRAGGVAGIGAAAAKPAGGLGKALPTMAGLSLARR